MSPHWRELPEQVVSRPALRAAVEARRYFKDSRDPYATWIQHGDLSIENVLLCAHRARRRDRLGRPEIRVASALRLLEFFLSTGYLTRSARNLSFSGDEDRWLASFEAIFFGDTNFSHTVRELLLHACKQLNVQPKLVPSLLVEYLLIRTHYYETNSISQRGIHLGALQLCLERS